MSRVRIVGIDPGLVTAALVAIDAWPGGASLVSTLNMSSKTGSDHARCLALSTLTCEAIVDHGPTFVALETNIMMGSKGRANGDMPLLGRGAILAGLGRAEVLGAEFQVMEANPSKWRKAIAGHGKALAGEDGVSKQRCPKRQAFLRQHLAGFERLKSAHEQDAAFLALWAAQQVVGAQAALDLLEAQP